VPLGHDEPGSPSELSKSNGIAKWLGITALRAIQDIPIV
jgi:hypothetical protein